MLPLSLPTHAYIKEIALQAYTDMLCQRATVLASSLRCLTPHLRAFSSTPALSYEYIRTETRGEKNNVGFVKFTRVKALNALCSPLMEELREALNQFDRDPEVGAVVITGSERAFAAGADIAEMQNMEFPEVYTRQFLSECCMTNNFFSKI